MDVTIETLETTPVVGITASVRMDQIGPKIGELLPEVMAAAGDAVAGPVIASWHCVGDGGDGDGKVPEAEMELAVPVSRVVAPTGRVAAAELPAGRAIVHWHVGPYEGLAATWGALSEWMQAEGHRGRAAPWEEYVSDCAVTPLDELRTKIVWPIE